MLFELEKNQKQQNWVYFTLVLQEKSELDLVTTYQQKYWGKAYKFKNTDSQGR